MTTTTRTVQEQQILDTAYFALAMNNNYILERSSEAKVMWHNETPNEYGVKRVASVSWPAISFRPRGGLDRAVLFHTIYERKAR